MKRLFLLLAIISCTMFAMAVPADRTPRKVMMADGTEITAILHGDEHYSWLETLDGRIIELGEDGKTYVWSKMNAEDIQTQVKSSRLRSVKRIGSQATAPLPSKGKVKIPVILVQFQDSVFHVGETDDEIREFYNLYCNGDPNQEYYKGHKSYGAISEYFRDQSDGQFTAEFTIIGPVTLSQKEQYYATRNTTFAKESVTLASAAYEGSWSDFDNQSKGQIDMLFIIFAGCGANTTGNRNVQIWPNETPLGTITLDDGTKLKFVCSGCCSENRLGQNSQGFYAQPDGIGVMCHELSHALGLPDFYNTNYKAFGMDLWSLMDYGCYGNAGYTPCAYTAYEREFMGWRPMETLSANGTITLDPITDGGIGYKVVNDENSDEYYILENRQSVGWDSGIFKRAKPGLQITHVDYNASKWNGNNVNGDVNHQRMTIIAANNRYIGTYLDNVTGADLLKTWAGNLYPYAYTDDSGIEQCNDSLTANSVPAATVFTAGGFMNKDIHAIKQLEDKSVSLYFGNDYVDAVLSVKDDDQRSVEPMTWFDMSGRHMAGKPTPPGLYISDTGKKRLIR